MFEFIRSHRRILQLILLILILPSFVFFGLEGYSRMGDDDQTVASVGKVKIRTQELEQAQRENIEQMQRMLGNNVDPKLFDTPEARKAALEGLINQRMLLAESVRLNLGVTDEKLRQTIAAIPAVQKDGKFDYETYKTLLAAQGMTPDVFEARLRQDLVLQALPASIGGTEFVPRKVSVAMAAFAEQRRTVAEWLFKPSDYLPKVDVSAADIKAFYESNSKLFETAERVDIEYLVLDARALMAGVALASDDVKAYYEQNKNRFGSLEERKVRHILIAVDEKSEIKTAAQAKARAEELLQRLKKNPGDFASIAKVQSKDPGSAANGGDLGFVSRGTMVKPFDDAMSALKEGELSGVVETEFGFHVLQVTAIKPATVKSFDEAKPEIESELRRQKATTEFSAAAESFTNTVYEQSDSLKPTAEKLKLSIQKLEGLTRSGPAGGGQPALSNPRFLSAIFGNDAVKEKRNTEAIDAGNATLIAGRVLKHYPPERRPLEAVSEEIKGRLLVQRAQSAAVVAGKTALESIKSKPDGGGFGQSKTIARESAEGFEPSALQAIFRAPTEKLPSFVGVELGSKGYAIYRITEVAGAKPGDASVVAREAAELRSSALAAGQESVNAYLAAIKSRSKVTVNEKRLAGSNRE